MSAAINSIRVAWLFPSLHNGNYWHPIIAEFSKTFPQTTVFTGVWAGFSPGFENAFKVEVLDDTKFVATANPDGGYSRSYIFPSTEIVGKLMRFRPQVIFTSAFSLWTAIALLLKPIFGWKVIILFDGVSNRLDYLNSGVRIIARRAMVYLIDAFVANSQAGKNYLVNIIKAPEKKVFSGVYLVPDARALSTSITSETHVSSACKRPIFLYVGQVIQRKGIHYLLDACKALQAQGYYDYTVVIVGDGAQRAELETFAQQHHLNENLCWIGQIEYHHLGAYFRQADVFVFPTLEDIWGMVPLEAMAFSKPVICSKWAGSADVMIDGENGYVVDPCQPEILAELMRKFIDNPQMAAVMGQRSQELIQSYTSESVSQFFEQVTDLMVSNKLLATQNVS